MDSAPADLDVIADEERYQAAVEPSTPYTPYGNTNPLKRQSPSPSPSSFSPAAVDHRLLSRGLRVLQLPTGSDNHRLPPAFPTRQIARSASDPVPLSKFQNPILSTQEKNSSRGSLGYFSAQDLPSPKRLKRPDQIERIRQMHQLLDEMVGEDELEDVVTRDSAEKGMVGGEGEAEEEMVSARKDGDTIHLKFKCNCGSGFGVVIIGECCYYKLI